MDYTNRFLNIYYLGDKLETATCIAKSSRLVSRTQNIHVFKPVSNRSEAHQELNAFRRKQDTALGELFISMVLFKVFT